MLCVLNLAVANDELNPDRNGGKNRRVKDNGDSKEMRANFIYVKEKSDLEGYGLQLASFASLDNAKSFARNIIKQGDAEKKQVFICSKNIDGKTFYKVYFGITKTDDSIRGKQKYFLENGQYAFVREFK
jgi:cell division septation protein DedD